jgi:hypothetical protein
MNECMNEGGTLVEIHGQKKTAAVKVKPFPLPFYLA